jgi:hypothetical protein
MTGVAPLKVSDVDPLGLANRFAGTIVSCEAGEGEPCKGVTKGDEIVAINGKTLLLVTAAEVLQLLAADVVRLRCIQPAPDPIIAADAAAKSDDCTIS